VGTKSPVARFYDRDRVNCQWHDEQVRIPIFCGPRVPGDYLLTCPISGLYGDLNVQNSPLLRYYCPFDPYFRDCLFVVKSGARSERPFNLLTERFKWEFDEVSLKRPQLLVGAAVIIAEGTSKKEGIHYGKSKNLCMVPDSGNDEGKWCRNGRPRRS
jgi:hypothetical protein